REGTCNEIDLANSEVDTCVSVSKEDLADNDYLNKNPAAKRTSEPTLEHYLFFEELLKEAATLMDKVHKYCRAAQNVQSPTWEKTSLQMEECSMCIRARS
ncbi:hypothetical protein CDAR_598011, partial [Caerostris darwini]